MPQELKHYRWLSLGVYLVQADPTNANVYVGNISPELTDAELRRHFSQFGAVLEVKSYRKGSFSFVQFQRHKDAVQVGKSGASGSAAVCSLREDESALAQSASFRSSLPLCVGSMCGFGARCSGRAHCSEEWQPQFDGFAPSGMKGEPRAL
jgi:RNA recognition motif. (a.k.a. RRM, RBD, or RNP domain)